DNLTMAEAVAAIERFIELRGPSLIVTPNAQHIVLLQEPGDFQSAYRAAALVLADSVPLVRVSRLLGVPLKERVAGADVMPALCRVAAEKHYRVFLLGAATGVAEKAAAILNAEHPDLVVSGTYCPPWGFEADPAGTATAVRAVRAAAPDVLFVALGTPKGEVWASKNLAALNVPAILCVGASFDFIAGVQKRAPRWVQEAGFEWAFRLAHDPRRLWKRYLIGNARFLFLTFRAVLGLNRGRGF
ncbi:MAG: WecB/TagA/CpsF family glycosyltransferase, partial [Candidatus Aminicenantes bacterium]|nr:WecB/TagA/CpsF family glycosyltransferase [Candidatus Aminicenantes bacterium]